MEDQLKEILYLKEQIKEKEKEINESHMKSLSQPSLYTNYNKVAFDRFNEESKKKIVSSTLNHQLEEKSYSQKLINQAKEQEIQIRLENLKKMREDQNRKLYERNLRLRSYKEDLDAQQYLKSKILSEEKADRKSPLPSQNESPIKPSLLPISQGLNSMYFTKRQPKTLCFNPITGSLSDTSQFLQGKFPPIRPPRQNESLFLPNLKTQDHIVTEFSALKAFQQPKFTKSHPKFTPSFPVTGGLFNA